MRKRRIAGQRITYFARLHLSFTRSLKAVIKKLRVSSAAIKITRSLKRFTIRKLDITDMNIDNRAGKLSTPLNTPEEIFILVAKRKEREYKI